MNITKKDVRDLLKNILKTDQWNKSQSEREQVVFVYKYCDDHGINASQYDMANGWIWYP